MEDKLQVFPGYRNLKRRQRDVIRHTLAIQERADKGSAEAKTQVSEWYCHASALAVECGDFNPVLLANIPQDYQKCEGRALLRCSELQHLHDFLGEFEAPFVVHLLIQYPQNYTVYHSLISLGQVNDRYYLWEKRAAGQPFMITSAQDLFREYPLYGWGKRHFVYDTLQKVLN